CVSHQKVIDAGANFPPTAFEKKDTIAKENQRQMVEFFNTKESKVKFYNQTLNQILTFWILSGALPWSHREDHFLHLAFRYVQCDIKIFRRTWVAWEAARIYLSLQDTVLKEIMVS
ncbi:hypothetical protein DFH28DRAFT_859988, partial [Melampsora americana]